jgi:uncharacterized protein involved in response to NO
MSTTAKQIREYDGPALLSYGFRPFFLAGAVWGFAAVALWLPYLWGMIDLPTSFEPLDWHMHELLFGFLPAVVTGFLLTAVPNWTGRLPVVGAPLLGLLGLWIAGRIAILVSGAIGGLTAAAIDLSFLVVLCAVVAREIAAGRNWRNLKVLAVILLLLAASALHHWETLSGRGASYGPRLGIATAVLLVMLIGGRVVPSFTRNWLAKRASGRLPQPFGKFDAIAIAIALLALVAWTLMPEGYLTAGLTALAGVLHAIRLARWAGDRTLPEPLVAILHAGYAFVPIGFLLAALHSVDPNRLPLTAPVHAWTVGMVGVMTLAIMTRATLGHTGRALTATPVISLIYLGALAAAGSRVLAALDFASSTALWISAIGWMVAFGGFVIAFGPMLWTRRTI